MDKETCKDKPNGEDNSIKIDYAAVLNSWKKRFDQLLKEQDEYFKLSKQVNELTPYLDCLSKHLYDMKLSDALVYLKAMVVLQTVSKHLCEKYGWDIEE